MVGSARLKIGGRDCVIAGRDGSGSAASKICPKGVPRSVACGQAHLVIVVRAVIDVHQQVVDVLIAWQSPRHFHVESDRDGRVRGAYDGRGSHKGGRAVPDLVIGETWSPGWRCRGSKGTGRRSG